MAVDGDDADSWLLRALKDADLAAAVLLSFREPRMLRVPRNCRLDRNPASTAAALGTTCRSLDAEMLDAEDDERPSTSAAPPTLPTAELPDWGRRIKRSRMVKDAGIREAAAAAAKGSGRGLASPQSPLDGYSSASTSGVGEEGASSPEKAAKVSRSSVGPAVVSPHGGGVPTKLNLELPKARVTDAMASMVLEDVQPPGPPLPVPHLSGGRKFILPDLNELPNCSD